MRTDTETPLTDEGRLVFGAGFAFGVACAMLVLAFVLVTVGGGLAMGSPTMVVVVAGVFFAGVVGVGLYFLAFPENRVLLPIDTERTEE